MDLSLRHEGEDGKDQQEFLRSLQGRVFKSPSGCCTLSLHSDTFPKLPKLPDRKRAQLDYGSLHWEHTDGDPDGVTLRFGE